MLTAAILATIAAVLLGIAYTGAKNRHRVTGASWLSMVGIVHNNGNVVPYLDGTQESQRQTQQIGEAVTSSQFTFTLDGGYDSLALMSVVPGAFISAKSAGSSSTKVSEIVIDSVSLTQVLVTVTLDAAPGVGETTDIACGIHVAGPQKR